jgi:molybdate transport system substrate-binding protein
METRIPRRKEFGAAGLAAALAVLVATLGVARAAQAEPLRVFAAASLTEAFQAIKAIYERKHPNDSVELYFAGSQILRTQIEQGAAADVFAAADLAHADALRTAKLLDAYEIFARNRIVVVVPRGKGKVSRLEDLATPDIKLVVAGDTVPVGHYTKAVLAKLDAAKLYGDGFQQRVQANVVSQETNARGVLSKVALDEADAGFVYVTDAVTSDKVRTIDVPDPYNAVAEYPIGMVARSKAPGKARAFIALVRGNEGPAMLRKQGFAP